MTSARLAFVAALVLAGCGAKQFGSICKDDPAPAQCGMACDPTPGAANVCGGGFHCSEDGACDAQCTAGGGECGDGYVCTGDGFCVGVDDPQNGPDASCPAINFTPMPTTPSILLVLDQSGSMFSNNLSAGVTRYAGMRDALVGTTGVVTQLETKAYFGSELYTCNGNNPALTAVPRALTNAGAIRTSIDSKNGGDNTPTAAAIAAGAASLMATPPPMGSPPVIVLATDGEPNVCGDNTVNNTTRAGSVTAVGNAFTAGYPVYVLAIGTSGAHFQNLANAGQGWVAGQPNVTYYPVATAAALKTAFDTIINGVISCDLSLTSTIDDAAAASGTVIVNGMTLTFGTDWILVNGNIIRLTGAACTNLKASANPTVSASFPCGSVIF